MMFTCVTPGCNQPEHHHLAMAAARKGGSKAARSKGHAKTVVRDRKGRALKVDIHCHYLNRDAAAKLAHLNPSQYEPSVKFASQLTREVNVKQMQDRAPKLSTIEVRIADMDRMGIDIQAVCPAPQQTYYWTEPGEYKLSATFRTAIKPAPKGTKEENGFGRVELKSEPVKITVEK